MPKQNVDRPLSAAEERVMTTVKELRDELRTAVGTMIWPTWRKRPSGYPYVPDLLYEQTVQSWAQAMACMVHDGDQGQTWLATIEASGDEIAVQHAKRILQQIDGDVRLEFLEQIQAIMTLSAQASPEQSAEARRDSILRHFVYGALSTY